MNEVIVAGAIVVMGLCYLVTCYLYEMEIKDLEQRLDWWEEK